MTLLLLASKIASKVVRGSITVAFPDSMGVVLRDSVRIAGMPRPHERPWWPDGLIALAGAIIGAVIAGLFTLWVTQYGLRRTSEEDRRKRRARLVDRLRRGLRRATAAIESNQTHNPALQFSPAFISEMENLATLFDMASDDLSLLGRRDLEERLEILFVKIRGLPSMMRDFERQQEALLLLVTQEDTDNPLRQGLESRRVRSRAGTIRRGMLETIQPWGAQAAALLAEFAAFVGADETRRPSRTAWLVSRLPFRAKRRAS